MDLTPYRPERNWRNAPPVRETDPLRARMLWLWLIGIVAALAPLVFYLVQTNRYTKTLYRQEYVRRGIEAMVEEERHLRVERTSLETLPVVEREARRLGLTAPAPESLIVVRVASPAHGELMARAPDDRDPDAR